MSKRFGKNKGKRFDKGAPRKFDPSPLVGDVDLSRKDVKVFLVKMPEHLVKQFEDSSRGVVGRMRLSGSKLDTLRPPDASNDNETLGAKTEPQQQEENPFVSQPLDTTVHKLNQKADGLIFIDKPIASIGANATGPSAAPPKRLASVLGSASLNARKFELFPQHTSMDMAIFSGASLGDNTDMKIEGIVHSQLQARPVMTDAFRKLNKLRTHTFNKRTSTMKIMTESQVKAADNFSLRPNAANETIKDREEKKRQKEESRRHLDVKDDVWREHTRTTVFKAFDIQAYYTADELAKTVDEPVGRLRPFITELCQYNKAGPFAQRYEIKDEYKTEAQRLRKERDLEQHRQNVLETQRKRKEEREQEREREKERAENIKKKARLH